jgi:cbb3-type cytochrome oxidase subunit 3
VSLTDLMSGAGLAGYAVVALLLFFGAFLALVAWVWWPTHQKGWSEAARIPLDDASTTTTESR